MKFEVKTDGYKVIRSERVILYEYESDCEINVDTENGFKFTIVLKFINDGNDKKEISVNKEVNGNTMTFRCANFDNVLGSGTIKPLPIATLNGKEVFMHFWSYSIGDSKTRVLDYTFLEKE